MTNHPAIPLFALASALAAQDAPMPRAMCFPPTAVRLLPGELRAEQDTMLGYLRTESLDRLLHNFRTNAGLPSSAPPLGGWEAPDCELRGHYTGHFLSALAWMHAATGDAALRERGATLVHGLAECQQKLGGGYLSAFPKSFLERLVRGEHVWAPWYTLHKVAAGLLDQHTLCGNAEALQVAVAFADFVDAFTKPLDEAAMQRMLQTEFGGMPAFFADLYAITQEPRHLDLARRFHHHRVLDPLAAGRDELKGLHANTQIPKVIAQARLFELTGEPEAGAIARFFWDTVTMHRCYATGGTSSFEYWRDAPDVLSWQLSSQDAENCCTHNLLKLTKLLWQQAPSSRFADYYERALWNGILGTKSPDDPAAIMYYVPMQGGLYRYYCERDNAYVCCSGTGIESFSRLGEFVYAHDEAGLWVNLFTPSEVDWAERGVRVRQETKFPDEAGTTLVVAAKGPTKFALRLRRPFWAGEGFAVTVNGAAVPAAAGADGYVAVEREWRDGDRVVVALPMRLRLEPLGNDDWQVAVCCGPIVLAMDLGPVDMTDEMKKGMGGEAYRRNVDGAPVEVPQILQKSVLTHSPLERWFLPDAAPLTFRTETISDPDANQRYRLQPFYRTRGTRYAIYLTYAPPPGISIRVPLAPDADAPPSLPDDAVLQAWQSERGRSHEHSWIRSPLWFRYDLAVDPAGDNTLRMTFARDEDATTFELCVDGVVVATPTLQPPPGDKPLFSQDFVLPRSATAGHRKVAIMIRVPPPPKAVDRGATTVPKVASPRRTPRVFAMSTNGLGLAPDRRPKGR